MGKTPGSNIHNLIFAAADRADMLRDDGTGTGTLEISQSQNLQILFGYVNLELATLWDVIISTYEDYCIYRRYIAVQPNVEDYQLPEDFYKFRKVFPISAAGVRGYPLKRFDLNQLGQADSLAAVFTGQLEDSRYKVTGNRLWLHPVPSTSGRLELWYVPQFRLVENDYDLMPVQFPNGWEEYVIEGVAARMLEKEESDASAHRRNQQTALQRIVNLAMDRDVGEPYHMQDTEGYLGSGA